MLELIYIGAYFRDQSNSIMGSLYEANTGACSDLACVEKALERGEAIHIRPATSKELLLYYKELAELKKNT